MQSIVNFDVFLPPLRVSAQNILSPFLSLSDYTSKATNQEVIITFSLKSRSIVHLDSIYDLHFLRIKPLQM